MRFTDYYGDNLHENRIEAFYEQPAVRPIRTGIRAEPSTQRPQSTVLIRRERLNLRQVPVDFFI